MKKRVREIRYTGDPLLIPIQSNELSVLVRLLYRLSSFLNDKVMIHRIVLNRAKTI